MEDTLRWRLVTAIAPIAWGSNYYVTHRYLPAGTPLWGAAFRALPAGLLLLAFRRELPRADWWWRSAVLGVMNMGAFFVLIYVAAQRLPTSTASMVMANSPIALMLVAWLVVNERPRRQAVAGAIVGILGAVLMLGGGAGGIDALGLAASLAAMSTSSFGFILTKRWTTRPGSPSVVTLTAWQLVAGGLVLVPVASAVHGTPPALDGPAVMGFGYVIVVATAIAFVAWFTGLRKLPAATVGLIGLLNPVTGVILGTVVSGESLAAFQIAGIALVFTGILIGQRSRPAPVPPTSRALMCAQRPPAHTTSAR